MPVEEDEIEVAHRIGTKQKDKSRIMVVRCSHKLKSRVFQYTPNLKNVQNEDKDKYSVRSQIPDPFFTAKKEREERLREIKKANAALSKEDQHKKVEAKITNKVLYTTGNLRKSMCPLLLSKLR